MHFIGKRRVLKNPLDRILFFRCVVERALSPCQFQTILLNPCELFSLRPVSMLMERPFGPTKLRIFNRTFVHIIMPCLSPPSAPNSIEPSLIMQRECIPFEFRVLFIMLWAVFFLHLAIHPVLRKFTWSTPLKSNCNSAKKFIHI